MCIFLYSIGFGKTTFFYIYTFIPNDASWVSYTYRGCLPDVGFRGSQRRLVLVRIIIIIIITVQAMTDVTVIRLSTRMTYPSSIPRCRDIIHYITWCHRKSHPIFRWQQITRLRPPKSGNPVSSKFLCAISKPFCSKFPVGRHTHSTDRRRTALKLECNLPISSAYLPIL